MSKILQSRTTLIYLFLVIVMGTGIHLLPFILYSSHPLGYDTGFYRRYLINPLSSFPNTPVPGLGKVVVAPRYFLDILRVLPFSPDGILYGSYIALIIAAAVIIFFLIKSYTNERIAFFASILFFISPIQYAAYWYMFYKEAFALLFMLGAFLLIERKSLWAIPVSLFVPLSHQTTTIIFLITLALFGVINKERRKIVATIFIGMLSVYLYLHPRVDQKIASPPTGTFLSYKEYLSLSLPLFVFALFGFRKAVSKFNSSIFMIFALISISFPLFALPNYQRIFAYTDIAIIVVAAIGLYELIKMALRASSVFRIFGIGSAIIVSLFIFKNLYDQVQTLRPLISQHELAELRFIADHIPANTSILTSPELTPWVEGWSQSTVFAPGLLKDGRSYDDWIEYWSTDNIQKKKDFLARFPKPLYFFIDPDKQSAFVPRFECVKRLTESIFSYQCN